MNDLTHLDLFSGIGGFALAAQRAGFRTIGFSEVEPYACRVLAERFPGVPNLGDVRRIESFAGIGPIAILSGGFPCQPWSVAGKQRGAADDRHLWPAMLRVIETAQPAWIIGENVPGIIPSGLDKIIDDLEGAGYEAQPLVIPACAVGAWHIRDRVWICAHNRKERGQGSIAQKIQGECAFSRSEDGGRSPHIFPRPDLYSPTLCSRFNGLSEELGAYGNAIVPQVAEPFFHWIAQIERGELA